MRWRGGDEAAQHSQCNIFNKAGRAGAAAYINGTGVFGSRSWVGPPQRPKLHSIHKGGRGHGSMANRRHSIEGKHGTLLRLGEDNNSTAYQNIYGYTKQISMYAYI